MFSPFSQAAPSSTPVVNPFAPKPKASSNAFGLDDANASNGDQPHKRKVRFSEGNNGDGKRKVYNPFLTDDENASDGGKRQNKHGGDSGKKKGALVNKKQANGFGAPANPQQGARHTNGFGQPASSGTNGNSAGFSSGADYADTDFSVPPNLNDPHAKKVYEQLRKDGIHPPQWPSQPGNPNNKAEMAKFREKYEAYRVRVRAALTKAGLIDDPDKRKTLQDAIEFKGICEDMCPEYEKITRITETDVHQPEKDPKTTFPSCARMVKKLARSAAGQEAPLPMDVRSIATLRRTLDYLIDKLLRDDGNLPALHGFLWDRTRAIRRDFTFFSSMTPDELQNQIYVLENITRFHVTALHLLSQEDMAPEDFVEQQELEQLGKALLSLRDVYDDCNAQGITCQNEAEFRAYYLVFHANDPNIMETVQRQWGSHLWKNSDDIRTAVSLVEALQNTHDFHGPLRDAPSLASPAALSSYLRIMQDPKVSYTMACFAECHLPQLRRSILRNVKRSLARPKETAKDVTAAVLNRFLQFDTVEEAIEFAELHELVFAPCDEDPSDVSRQYLILNNRQHLPHHRLQHHFSHRLVEKKRGAHSLPELIHQTVFEDLSDSKTSATQDVEETIFVPSTIDFDAFKPSQDGPISTNSLRFPSTAFAESSFATGSKASPFGSVGASTAPESQPSAAANPFAPAPKAAEGTSAANPFGSLSNPTAANPFAQAAFPAFGAKTRESSDNTASREPSLAGFSQPPNNAIASASGISSSTTGNFNDGQTSASSFVKPPIPMDGNLPPTNQTDSPTSNITTAPSTQSFAAPALPKPSFPSTGGTITTPPLDSIPSPSSAPPTASSNTGIVNNITETPVPNFLSSTNESTKRPLSQGFQSTPPSLSTDGQPAGVNNPKFPSFPASGNELFPQAQPSQNVVSGPIPSPTTQPQAPPRDLLSDFARWFVRGDDGILQDFQDFIINQVVSEVFTKFDTEQRETREREEEENDRRKADEFHRYNVSLKFFYRWKRNAREKRLRELRRSGREQFRHYYETRRAEELEATKAAAAKAASEQAELAGLDRPQELKTLLSQRKPKLSRQQAEKALLESGVLSGVNNEQEALTSIFHKETHLSPASSSHAGQLTRSRSGSITREGSKSRALREQFLGSNDSTGFRRSLPPMSSSVASPRGSNISKIPVRWRLKAMGLVQLPDGTAVPENLAKRMSNGTGSPGRIDYTSDSERNGRASTLAKPHQRSVSLTGNSATLGSDGTTASTQKRKRATEDEGGAVVTGAPDSNKSKRLLSEAQEAIRELRALRMELEEDTVWFKDQNERLQSEALSNGTTP